MKQNKLKAENAEKLRRIYLKYRVFLFRNAAFPILKDHALAEDAVQETFARLIGHEHKIEEEDERKTKNFLATVCKHVAIDMYNKRTSLNKNTEYITEIDAQQNHEPDLLTAYLDKEEREALVQKAKTLNPIYQSIFFMRYTFEYSYEEIASILKLEPATVRKRMERLRKQLIKKEGRR